MLGTFYPASPAGSKDMIGLYPCIFSTQQISTCIASSIRVLNCSSPSSPSPLLILLDLASCYYRYCYYYSFAFSSFVHVGGQRGRYKSINNNFYWFSQFHLLIHSFLLTTRSSLVSLSSLFSLSGSFLAKFIQSISQNYYKIETSIYTRFRRVLEGSEPKWV